MKHVLILVGSARVGGCTQAAAETAKAAMEQKGYSAELLRVADMDIHGCIGCEQCWTGDFACVQAVDMQKSYEAVERCDLILLASPMYYAALSSQLKAVVDRFHSIRKSCRRTRIQLAGKECALLVIGHVPEPEKYEGICLQHKLMCAHLDPKNAGTFVVRGCFHEGDFQTLDQGVWPSRVTEFAQSL